MYFFKFDIIFGIAKAKAAAATTILKLMGPKDKYFPPPEKLQSTKNKKSIPKEITSHFPIKDLVLKTVRYSFILFVSASIFTKVILL